MRATAQQTHADFVRFERMRRRDVLWQTRHRHAGIATQMVVERPLMERQRVAGEDMGRVPKNSRAVWNGRPRAAGVIVHQLMKRLGAPATGCRANALHGRKAGYGARS